MGVLRRAGKIVKPFVNVPHWMGLSQIISQGKWIGRLAKDLTSTSKQTSITSETFDEAVNRYHLSEEELQRRQQNFLLLSIIYLIFAITVLIYVIYLVFYGTFLGCLMGLSVFVLALAFAFREHFHYFQMKERRLGCTLKDWVAYILRGKSHAK